MPRLLVILLIVSSCAYLKQNILGVSICNNRALKRVFKKISPTKDKESFNKAFSVQALPLINCYKNYLKFEKNKVDAKMCIILTVSKRGKPKYVNVSNQFQVIPRPLRWCVEQQLWKMNFAHSNLTSGLSYKKIINFKPEMRKD